MSMLDELIGKLGDLFGLGTTLTQEQQDALTRYGGYQLQWGDDDTKNPPIYEGFGRVPPDTLPDPGADGYVTVLQKDLQQLGIMPALPITGVFDRYTSWKIREFQIYADMDKVATEDPNAAGSYADRLTGTANTQKYQGDITGRLDGATAVALKAWITNNYRCPVVAESRDQNFNLIVDNVWFASEDAQQGHLCWVTDLTGTYAVNQDRLDAQGGGADPNHHRILAGSFTTSAYGNGPVCQAGTVWTDDAIPQCTDITIQTLTGDQLAQATAPTISTYKVVRAVANRESGDNFDGVNSWDSARVSFGPYHFALFLGGGSSELPAFLSFLAAWAPDDFKAAFGRYGIDTAQAWPADATAPTTNNLYNRQQRKWTTYVQQRGLQTPTGVVAMAKNRLATGDDADYLRNWHWFYRWVMACRLFPNIWLKCWDFCRYRIQALLQAPFPHVAGLPDRTTLGQVYTSEYAITALLRAHVNVPKSVIMQGGASDTVVSSLTNAMANDPTLANNLANWTDQQHKNVDGELVSGLIAKARNPDPKNPKAPPWPYAKDMMIALEYISPEIGASVSVESGSFQFDPP